MEHIWEAVEAYYSIPCESDRDLQTTVLNMSAYSAKLRVALATIQAEQARLDAEDIPLDAAAIRAAHQSARRHGAQDRVLFGATFRAAVPQYAALFDAIVARKALSLISISK